MAENSEMMRCDWCGKEFPADARACVEGGVEYAVEGAEGEEWKLADGGLAEMLSAEDRERVRQELGLEEAELVELLATGKVEGLGSIVCLECQEAGQEQGDNNE